MWLTKTWVLLYVACASPGTAAEACTPHHIDGFVSERMCQAALPAIAETIGATKATGVAVDVTAQCISATPDREV